VTHLAKDCPDKGQNGFGGGAKGPVHNCKFFLKKKLNLFSTFIFVVLMSSAAFLF
jgi:hypothetical protein